MVVRDGQPLTTLVSCYPLNVTFSLLRWATNFLHPNCFTPFDCLIDYLEHPVDTSYISLWHSWDLERICYKEDLSLSQKQTKAVNFGWGFPFEIVLHLIHNMDVVSLNVLTQCSDTLHDKRKWQISLSLNTSDQVIVECILSNWIKRNQFNICMKLQQRLCGGVFKCCRVEQLLHWSQSL